MISSAGQTCRGLRLAATVAVLLSLAGCTLVGPSAILNGRAAYNEAIITTSDQQMLQVAIHNRYEERSSLLAVASVTANVSVRASAGLQAGLGNDENYAGNLVPFSAGAAYEENPTISYVPVAGEHYLRAVMLPVPVTTLAQVAAARTDPRPAYAGLVSSINGLQNPDFFFSGLDADPRFDRVVTLMTELTQARRLHWVRDAEQAGSLVIVLDNRAPVQADQIRELLTLLGLTPPEEGTSTVTLPVFAGLEGSDRGGIAIRTRSVFQMLEILSAAIEVPEKDLEDGAVSVYPPAGPVGSRLRIAFSQGQPEHAVVAVAHRGGWFYIDERDQSTKRFFRQMASLWDVAMAESVASSSATPVLTVPVSR